MSTTPIINLRPLWYTIAAVLAGVSLAFLAMWGLRQGIEFTGGSLMALRFQDQRPAATDIQGALDGVDVGALLIQPVGERDMNMRMKTLTEDEHTAVTAALVEKYPGVQELRYDAIGPTIGQELRSKSLTGLLIVLAAILAYIAFAFRGVSAPVQSWKYGIVTIAASAFVVIVPLGLYSFLGHVYDVEIGTPFVAAIMTIIGYSITDTIVVMDRIRENLRKTSGGYAQVVEASIRQTFVRSITNSMATLLTLLAIFLYGGDTLDEFTLPLIVGIVIGTFSSMLFASPLLVTWNKFTQRKS
jgi:preprotein translocase subunit SecF